MFKHLRYHIGCVVDLYDSYLICHSLSLLSCVSILLAPLICIYNLIAINGFILEI